MLKKLAQWILREDIKHLHDEYSNQIRVIMKYDDERIRKIEEKHNKELNRRMAQ